jgi:hypothetical protein
MQDVEACRSQFRSERSQRKNHLTNQLNDFFTNYREMKSFFQTNWIKNQTEKRRYEKLRPRIYPKGISTFRSEFRNDEEEVVPCRVKSQSVDLECRPRIFGNLQIECEAVRKHKHYRSDYF